MVAAHITNKKFRAGYAQKIRDFSEWKAVLLTETCTDGALRIMCGRTGVNLVRHNRTLFITDEKIQILPLCERISSAVV